MSNVINFPLARCRPSSQANSEWMNKIMVKAYEERGEIPTRQECDCMWRVEEGSIACTMCDDNLHRYR